MDYFKNSAISYLSMLVNVDNSRLNLSKSGAPLKTTLLKLTQIAFIFCSVIVNTSIADFEAGIEANRNNDRATAFSQFHAAALDKDSRAYGKLGSMYLYGLGTQKNYKQAYIWFHMAHLTGEKESVRFRDAASSMLSNEEYADAVKEAEVLKLKHNLGKTAKQ